MNERLKDQVMRVRSWLRKKLRKNLLSFFDSKPLNFSFSRSSVFARSQKHAKKLFKCHLTHFPCNELRYSYLYLRLPTFAHVRLWLLRFWARKMFKECTQSTRTRNYVQPTHFYLRFMGINQQAIKRPVFQWEQTTLPFQGSCMHQTSSPDREIAREIKTILNLGKLGYRPGNREIFKFLSRNTMSSTMEQVGWQKNIFKANTVAKGIKASKRHHQMRLWWWRAGCPLPEPSQMSIGYWAPFVHFEIDLSYMCLHS